MYIMNKVGEFTVEKNMGRYKEIVDVEVHKNTLVESEKKIRENVERLTSSVKLQAGTGAESK